MSAVRDDFWLSKDAVKRLAGGYERITDQCKELDRLCIPYKVVRREVLVMTSHAAAWVENRPVRQEVGIDFSAVR